MDLPAGTRFDRYEILAPLGAGGMGQVYRARDTKLEREVALKVLPEEVARDRSRLKRFEQEARAVAALNHPNIVSLYDVGEGYFVSELVDGEPIGGNAGVSPALAIAAQIADGVAAAHDAGIVHRDLKPGNILLRRDGRIKILDFGLAKVDPRSATESNAHPATTATMQTQPGVVMGTAGYMSPEQISGGEVDTRSDIFNIGIILYELVTGERPFHGDTGVEVMAAILKQEPLPLLETVPHAVRRVVFRCLEKKPENRFQSAADLAFSLRECLDLEPSPAAATMRRRSWRLPVAVLAGGTMLGLTAGLLFLSPSRPVSWAQMRMGGPEVAWRPRLSPDGSTLAMLTMVANQSQVAVMRPESGDWSILTREQNEGATLHLSWSPDGSRIYYDRQLSMPSGIYSVPVIGGSPRLVLEKAGAPEALPDGSLIVGRFNSRGQMQACRFWPDTGRVQEYPFELTWDNGGPIRALPGGKEAAFIGTPIPPVAGSPTPSLYILDLTSGQFRPLYTVERFETGSVTVTTDGRNVLFADRWSGVRSIEAAGRSPFRNLFPLPGRIFTLDAGPAGIILADQIERTPQLVLLANGRSQYLLSTPATGPANHFTTLPDGRAVWVQAVAGRDRLIAIRPGLEPEPLISTSEPTSTPAAQLGTGELAFLLGPPGRREIGIASLVTGRIMRRIPFDKGEIISMSAPSDGQTLYCVSAHTVWAVPTTASDGPIRRIMDGDGVAADPDGGYLAVVSEKEALSRLYRVPLDGGPPKEIQLQDGVAPTRHLGARGLSRDGRLLNGLALPNSWFYDPYVIDLRTGRVTKIAKEAVGDYYAMNWTNDGQVMAVVSPLRAAIWKFTPDTK